MERDITQIVKETPLTFFFFFFFFVFTRYLRACSSSREKKSPRERNDFKTDFQERRETEKGKERDTVLA